MVIWKFESSQVSQAVRRSARRPGKGEIRPEMPRVLRLRFRLQTPKSVISGRQLAKVSGHVREYSRFTDTPGGDRVRSQLPPEGDTRFGYKLISFPTKAGQLDTLGQRAQRPTTTVNTTSDRHHSNSRRQPQKCGTALQIDAQQTLFGGWSVVREWGRIGRGGTVRTEPHPTGGKADIALIATWAEKQRRRYR
jgi:hypothetical protein